MATSAAVECDLTWTSDLTPEGPLPKFVDVEPRLSCCKCHQVLQCPVQTRCGHRMCQACAREVLSMEDPPHCPARQDDCALLKDKEINADHVAFKEVSAMQVYCHYNNNGCQETVMWKQLQAHVAQCQYVLVQCSRRPLGCQQMVCAVDLQHHLLDACEYRPEPCPHCRTEVPRKNLEMDKHKETCGSRPTDCLFRHIGCQHQCKADEMPQHMQDDMDQSPINTNLTNKVNSLTVENSQLRQMLDRHSQTLTQNSHALAQVTSILENQADTIQKQADTIDTQDKAVTQNSDALDKMSHIKDKPADTIDKQDTTVTQDLAQVKQILDKLTDTKKKKVPTATLR